jgi:hypothetical protein
VQFEKLETTDLDTDSISCMGEKAIKMTTADLQKVILIDIYIAIPPLKGDSVTIEKKMMID